MDHYWLPDKELSWIPGIVETQKDGKVTFKTIYDGAIVLDASSIEKLEKVSLRSLEGGFSNLVMLDEFGEGPVVHQLRERYKNDHIYTNIGTILISVNPFKFLPIYGAKDLQHYRDDYTNAEPHVFKIAAEVYAHLFEDHKSQTVIISGESGAGKTEATKTVLQYLSEVGGSTEGVEQQILQSNPLLEAFGNAKTVRNNNSSRFGKWMEVGFEASGTIVNAQIVNYLLEKSRVVALGPHERNYHIFYQLISGLPEQQKSNFGITGDPSSYHYLNQSGVYEVDSIDDRAEFRLTRLAMDRLKFYGKECTQIWAIVGAVLNLGNCIIVQDDDKKDGNEYSKISNTETVEIVAHNLKLEPDELEKAICYKSMSIRGSITTSPLSVKESTISRDSLSKALYGKLFDWIVFKVNKTLSRKLPTLIVGILDVFGFEIFEQNFFEQFCINYANEKLQQHFTSFIFKQEQEEYKNEGIDVSRIEFDDNEKCLEMIEAPRGKGIISLFDAECSRPGGNDKDLIDKMHQKFAEQKQTKNSFYRRIRKTPEIFVIKHYAGEVKYNSQGLVEKNRDKLYDSLSMLVQKSELIVVKQMFDPNIANSSSSTTRRTSKKLSAKTTNPSTKTHRKSNRTLRKVKSLGSQFQSQMKELYNTIGDAAPHFIRCIKPNVEKKPNIFTTPLCLSQMRNAGLFEAIRIRKSGFQFRQAYKYFVLKYRVCLPKEQMKTCLTIGNDKEATEFILEALSAELDRNEIALGKTKIFMRNSQRVILGKIREEALTICVIKLQSWWRGILARRNIHDRKHLYKEAQAAIEKRDLTRLMQVINESEEKHIELFLLQTVQVMAAFLQREKRLSELMEKQCKLGDDAKLDLLQTALDEAKKLSKDFPGQEHTKSHMLTSASAQKLCDRLILRKKAARKLDSALMEEKIEELRSALQECQKLGLSGTVIVEAEKKLKQLENEEKIMQDLIQFVAESNVGMIIHQLTLIENLPKNAERNKQISAAQKAVFTMYEKEVDNTVQCKDAAKIEKELLPVFKKLDKQYADLVVYANKGLKIVYSSLCDDYVDMKNSKSVEEELIPKLKKLGFDDVVPRAESALCRIYESFIQDALVAKDTQKLEGDLKRKIKCLEPPTTFGYLLEHVSSALGNIYVGLIHEAELTRDAVKLEELLMKTKELKLELATDNAFFSLEKVYQSTLDSLIANKNEQKIANELIPKAETLKLESVLDRAKEFLRDQNNLRLKEKEEKKKRALLKEEEKRKAEEEERQHREEEKRRQEEEKKKREEKRKKEELQKEAEMRAKLEKQREEERAKIEKRKEEEEKNKKELQDYLETPRKVPNSQHNFSPAIDENQKLKDVDQKLDKAIKNEDLDIIAGILDEAKRDQLKSKKIENAHKYLTKKIESTKLLVNLQTALDEANVEETQSLLTKIREYDIGENDLVTEANHFCYIMTEEQKITKQVKKAMNDNNIDKLKTILKEAKSKNITNQDIENAETLVHTRSMTTHSKKPTTTTTTATTTTTSSTGSTISEQERQYEKFIKTRGQLHLSDFDQLRPENNYAKKNYFRKKGIKSKRLIWQKEDIPRSLVKLSTAYCGYNKVLSKHIKGIAIQIFKNIRGYMGDVYHPYPVTLAYEIINVAVHEPLLRDEIFSQLIKQTTQNASSHSVLFGMKLMYMCISTFLPSDELLPILLSHIANIAHQKLPPTHRLTFDNVNDLGTNCWIAFRTLQRAISEGRTLDAPTMNDIEMLTSGNVRMRVSTT